MFIRMLVLGSRDLNPDLEIDARDVQNRTPLHMAACSGNIEVIRVLLELGASLDAVSARGMTPLHYAVENGSLAAVVAILDAGADVNASGSSRSRPIALHIAAGCGHIEIMEELLARGADPNAQIDGGQSPLFFAIEAPDRVAEAVEILLNAGTDAHQYEKIELNTVLHVVAEREDLFCPRIFSLLVEREGLDIEQTNHCERTALHLACLEHNEPMIDALMKAGADENAVAGNMGWPAHHACYRVFEEFDAMERVENWPQGTPEEERPALEAKIIVTRRIHHRLSQGPQDRENIRATKAWRKRGWLVVLRIRRRGQISAADTAVAASSQPAWFDSATVRRRGSSPLAVLNSGQGLKMGNSGRSPVSVTDKALAELPQAQLDKISLGNEPTDTREVCAARDEGVAATETDDSNDRDDGGNALFGVVNMLTGSRWEHEDLFREIVMFI